MGILDVLQSPLFRKGYAPQADDINENIHVHRSFVEYHPDGTLNHILFEMDMLDRDGEWVRLYKAIKLLRLIRLPKEAKQTQTIMEIHSDILAGIWEREISVFNLIANIIEPDPQGLLFMYGVQGVSDDLEEAKIMADNDFEAMVSLLQGSYKVMEFDQPNHTQVEWIRRKMSEMKQVQVIRGIPMPHRSSAGGGTSDIGGRSITPEAQETTEEFILGMADKEYILLVLATPIPPDVLQSWLTSTSKHLTRWNAVWKGSKSVNFGLSMPMVFAANLGSSMGTSHGLSAGQSYGENIGDSFTQGTSEGFSSSLGVSQSHGDNIGMSAGVSQSEGISQSHSISDSTSVGQSYSIGESSSIGVSESNSTGTSHSVGSSESTSESVSTGVSDSTGTSHSTGTSTSESSGTSHSENWGANEGTSTGHNTGTNSGTSKSNSVGGTLGIKPFGIGVSGNASKGWGESSGISEGFSSGSSEGQSWGNSVGSSSSSSNGTSTSDGTSTSHGTSSSQSTSVSRGTSVSDGTSTSHSVGTSASMGRSTSAGVSTSQSHGESVGFGTSQSAGQSLGKSMGQSNSTGMSASQGHSVGTSTSVGQTSGKSWGSNTGTNEGVSSGLTQGTSASGALGPSFSWAKSYQWEDVEVRNIVELLEYNRTRLIKALNGQGAFFTDVFIATPDTKSQSAAGGLAVSSWYSHEAMTCPLQVIDLNGQEAQHMLYHIQAFSPDVTREGIEHVMESYRYSTVLTSDELTAYNHPPRVTEGGLLGDIENLPIMAVKTNMKGEVYIGKQWSGQRFTQKWKYATPYDYRIQGNELMHALFAGQSRSGKTVGALRVSAGFINNVFRGPQKKHLRFVVLDPKDDWRTLAKVVDPKRFRFHSLSDPRLLPVKFNLLRIPKNVIPERYMNLVSELFALSYGLGPRGLTIFKDALYNLYNDAHMFDGSWDEQAGLAHERSKSVNMGSVFKRINDSRNNMTKSGNDAKDAMDRVLDRLRDYGRDNTVLNELFSDPNGVSVDEILGDDHVTVLETKGLGALEQKFIFGLFTAGIYSYCTHNGGFINPPEQYETVLIIEEANEFLIGSDTAGGKKGDSPIPGPSEFEKILDQAAGNGLYIWSITQKPSQMPSSVIANSAMLFAGRTQTPDDIKVVMNKVGKEEKFDNRDLYKFFPRCSTGLFMVASSRTFDFKDAEPTWVQFDPIPLVKPTNDELILMARQQDVMKNYDEAKNALDNMQQPPS